MASQVCAQQRNWNPNRHPVDWINSSFLVIVHLAAIAAIFYFIFVKFSWLSLMVGAIWMCCCMFSISGGYHRLFSHSTYKAKLPLKLFLLLFGAASVQNSALNWSADHRRHHAHCDKEDDPYNIKRGFLWAHVGWVLFKNPNVDYTNVKDLLDDRLIMFQHKYYVLLAFLVGLVLPGALGLLWGDPVGAILWATCIRLMVQYHITFSINSLAHMIGYQPYSVNNTARDSTITAFLTFGEGYHNFHHRFPFDYRNGVRFFHFDPTKWAVWCFSKIGITSNLKRVSKQRIEEAKALVRQQQTETSSG